ncbi:hypothetical protein ALQ62_00487 [Pseudomonas coronafaciens pv. zizaniae]|uniref:dermonecrotic toxin domain-containing protein n=1 Tax=Pseudomonas coronafaciens TaxID=53409 RepID=UPI000EFF6589|nr:DUF6543 domain-containing protein [Pseudomonas coronafaciens]RMN25386.1 hypothetical protein ALQ62_00487 [Pseudomonas coronafaciens pv. zizaniae]
MSRAAPAGKLARSYDQLDAGSHRFTPSTLAIREHRARERADRFVDQFIEHFPEKNYFPDGDDGALFALLVQMPEWPADLMLRVQSENDEVLALYLKGNDKSVARQTVVLTQSADDTYIAPDGVSIADEEPLLHLVFSQLPPSCTLGAGGNFPGSNSVPGRIVTLREQVAGLARAQRPLFFDAFLAADFAFKSQSLIRPPNPFLPLWKRGQAERSPVLSILNALTPDVPLGRLEDLLDHMKLSEEQETDFLENGILPDAFVEAMTISSKEWSSSLAIDGLSRTRFFNSYTHELAYKVASELLASELRRELVIVEVDKEAYVAARTDETQIVLLHDGYGNYRAQDASNREITEFKEGTDSFYLAISSQLKDDERALLGLQFEQDIKGFRSLLTRQAINENQGWFDPEKPTEIDTGFLPDWFANATDADKRNWKTAVHDYSMALLEAQTPDLLDPSLHGQPEQLRKYAREKLKERIMLDHGVALDPDEISVHTYSVEIDPDTVVDIDFGFAGPSELEPQYVTESRSLTDLSLKNLTVTNLNFLLASHAFDSQGQRLSFLNAGYLFAMIRDLNIGEDYSNFLRTVLSTSASGQWHRECYARAMQAQMRLDAIEAKMAGDFLGDGGLPEELANRGYKWVMAALNHPVGNDEREAVEGHRLQVSQLSIDGIPLGGILVFSVESRASVVTVVVFTPQAPDGLCFREISSAEEFLNQVLLEPALLDYLVSRAHLASRADIRHALTAGRDALSMELLPCNGSFLEAIYDFEVERVISAVDEQTTSTWETNWESAWEIAKTFGDIVLAFAPFRVRLPIAAIRSFYAIWQGVQKAGGDEKGASLYFVQAALLLADGLIVPTSRRVKSPTAIAVGRAALDPKIAVSRAPRGLNLREDGIYKGVHEKVQEGAASRFYAVQQGKTYAVRYDTDVATWRVIDARRPDAYYQVPIRFDEKGSWVQVSVGLRGGKKGSKAKKSDSGSGSDTSSPDISTGKKLFELDMSGFFESSAFKKAQKNIQDDLIPVVKKAVEKYRLEGKGSLHPSKAGLYSLDLPGVGKSTGRGAWRLMFEPPKKGVLKVHSILDPH